MKIRPFGDELVNANGWTDEETFIHSSSILSDDRSKASSKNDSSTLCYLELPPSNESVMSFP
jgi:hypothetical protein